MIDISDDYQIFDNTEAVTIQNPGVSAIVANNVVRRPAMTTVTDSNGQSWYYQAAEFWVWKNELPVGFVPKINAKVTDQLGKIYNIDSCDDGALRTRWVLKGTSQAGQIGD